MKREKFLWPLSQGHHRGLAAAKNIKNRIAQLVPENQEREMALLREEVSRFWEGELKPHFTAEEEMIGVFTAHAGPRDPDATRVLNDHRNIEQLVKSGFKEDLLRLADLLTAHIHYEEDVFFGRIEKTLSPAEILKEGEELLKIKNEGAGCQIAPKPPQGN